MTVYKDADENPHLPTSEPNYSESVYLNYYDTNQEIGGFVRIGNRPNEHRAEVTNAIYMPHGEALFSYSSPAIDSNSSFEAGEIKYTVIEPFRQLELQYQGNMLYLKDPLALADPKAAYAKNPKFPLSMRLQVTSFGPVHDSVNLSQARGQIQYWKEHYEQLVFIRGEMKFSDTSIRITAYGVRDHSWGARNWQLQSYRWLSGAFAEKSGFGLMYIDTPGGLKYRSGWLFNDGETRLIQDAEIKTEFGGPLKTQNFIQLTLITTTDRIRIKGKVLNLLPLRSRRHNMITHINEGCTRWLLKEFKKEVGHICYV